MAKKKMISVDVAAMKDKAQEVAKDTAASVSERLQATRQKLTEFARDKKDQAVTTLLTKGVELSKKQVAALEKAKKRFT